MKKVIIVALILLLNSLVSAQVPKGFTPVANVSVVQTSLARSSKTTNSIVSDFTQTKHMKMLQDKVNSKGKFFFKKEQKLRIEYTSPFQYLLVMNNGQIFVKDGDKTNKINARNSKAMQSANKIMMDCMTGNVFQNKDFLAKAFETKTQYLLQLTPVTASMKGMFARIDVFLDKSDNSVSTLVMNELGGDYTEMNFGNKKLNTVLSDALFNLR